MSHGLMFHHFYDDVHPKGQGAISAQDFRDMLIYIGLDRILSAEEYFEKAVSGELKPTDRCLTFDDALLCQYDIAYPVMQDLGLTAFWFVYSSVLEGNIEPLEVFRYFRTKFFDDIDDFYIAFFDQLSSEDPDGLDQALRSFDSKTYLAQFPFYSDNDRKFRFLRDVYLGPDKYNFIMAQMISDNGMNIADFTDRLWMNEAQLKELKSTGNVIGLHSYSHPTRLHELPVSDQAVEYQKNFDHLKSIVGAPQTSSHPCNSYSKDTLDILRGLGIKMSFCSNMSVVPNRTILELPREDHINIYKEMRA